MTDKELLDLAASAIGISLSHSSMCGISPPEWNPLEDDGEALRLAIALRMNIEVWNDCVFVTTTHRATGQEDVEESAGNDLERATRRAIVRIAAEIGKRALTPSKQ